MATPKPQELVNTVKSHRLRIYQKLHLHTRAELVARLFGAP